MHLIISKNIQKFLNFHKIKLMNKIKIIPHLQINGYEFQHEIGRGQFSVVWEAIHLSTKNKVAIKCILNNSEHVKTEIAVLKEIYINQQIFHTFI